MADTPHGFRATRAGQRLLDLLSKAAALLILVGVGAGVGGLISPSLPEQFLPDGEDSVGRLASQTIRISRDYDVPDPEATERRRAQALADVRPVYDFDARLLPEVASRVAESFAFARAGLAAHPAGQGRQLGRGHEGRGDAAGLLREELMGRLQTFIDPRDFAALRAEGFSQASETALQTLVRAQLSQSIVEDRALLPAERERGIFIRESSAGGGEVITDLDSLRDLPSARAEVERAADALPEGLSVPVRRALGRLARGALRANLTYDAAETARRRERAGQDVVPIVIHLSRGDRILEAGERIEPRHLLMFRAIRAQVRPVDAARARVGGGLLAALLAFLCYKLVRPTMGRRPTRRDALFLGVVLMLTLSLTQGLLLATALWREGVLPMPAGLQAFTGRLTPFDGLEALPFAMPVAAGTLLVRLLLGPEFVALYAIGSSAFFGLLRGGSLPFALFALAGSLVAARRVRWVARRRQLFNVGFFIATTNAVVILCSQLLSGRVVVRELLAELGASVLGGLVVTPLLVGALMPLLEAVFGYVSDASLSELCNLNQPALKELIVRAPGTYHHSIVLAGLAERAALAIGANPLWARAIGLYHDLGKGRAPLVFSENQKGLRVDQPPGIDLLELLRRHVADGVELGRRHKLPRALLQALAQHHGTRRVGPMLEGGSRPSVLRYPGPLPSRRETGLVLLADAVEAQSRRLSPRDVPWLAELIAGTVSQIAAEGQLDESGLSLGDLARVVKSFSADLTRAFAERGPEPTAPAERPAQRSALEIN